MEIAAFIVGVLSLAGTFFAIGYTIGKDSRGSHNGWDSCSRRRDRSDKTQK